MSSLAARSSFAGARRAVHACSRHNLAGYRLRAGRWHTEFVTFMVLPARPLADDIASVDAATVEIPPTAIAAVPVTWLQQWAAGERLVALPLWVA